MQCCERDLNVDIAGMIAERFFQHRLRRRKSLFAGLVDLGGGLLDHDLSRPVGRWRAGLQQLIEAQREQMAETRREPRLLHG